MAPSTLLPRRKKRSDDGIAIVAKSWRVYMLRCADGSLYTGCTNDLTRRLLCHGRRQVKYTRGRLPVELVYEESVDGKSSALRREIAIKRLRRSQKLALADGRKL